jgi:hypothetical protein
MTSSKISTMPCRSVSAAHAVEVAGRIDDDAVGADHRLDQRRGHVGRTLVHQHVLEVIERAARLFLRILGEERTAVRVRREEVDHAGDAGFVRPASVLARQLPAPGAEPWNDR